MSQGSEFSTRDLLYDKDTHKQFITVEGRDGKGSADLDDYDYGDEDDDTMDEPEDGEDE